jgi:hypothetical protein
MLLALLVPLLVLLLKPRRHQGAHLLPMADVQSSQT